MGRKSDVEDRLIQIESALLGDAVVGLVQRIGQWEGRIRRDSPRRLYEELAACRSLREMRRLLFSPEATGWRIWWIDQAFDLAAANRAQLGRIGRSHRDVVLRIAWLALQRGEPKIDPWLD